MSSSNSLPGYVKSTLDSVHTAQGITSFQGADRWERQLGDLMFQGGKLTAGGTVSFLHKFPSQLLYLSVSAGTATGESTTGFTASAAGYWLAIGV